MIGKPIYSTFTNKEPFARLFGFILYFFPVYDSKTF